MEEKNLPLEGIKVVEIAAVELDLVDLGSGILIAAFLVLFVLFAAGRERTEGRQQQKNGGQTVQNGLFHKADALLVQMGQRKKFPVPE